MKVYKIKTAHGSGAFGGAIQTYKVVEATGVELETLLANGWSPAKESLPVSADWSPVEIGLDLAAEESEEQDAAN